MVKIDLSARLMQGLYKFERKDFFEREHFLGVIAVSESVYFFNAYRTNGIFFTGGRKNDKIKEVDRPIESLSNDILLNLGLLTFKEAKRCQYLGRAGKVMDSFRRHYNIIEN